MRWDFHVVRQTRGFSLKELLVVLSVLGVLFFGVVILSVKNYAKTNSQRVRCANNLKTIGLSFRTWSTDSSDDFPTTRGTNFGGSKEWTEMKAEGAKFLYQTFLCLSNDVKDVAQLVCPADIKRPANGWKDLADSASPHRGNAGISYGVGGKAHEAYPTMLLVMDRHIVNPATKDGSVIMPDQINAQWGYLGTNQTESNGANWAPIMHSGFGLAAMGDGSVVLLSRSNLLQHLRDSGDPNPLKNEIQIPGSGAD